MDWKSIDTPPLGNKCWYVVALNPIGIRRGDASNNQWLNKWRTNTLYHAFEKAYLSDGRWLTVDHFVPKRIDVTDRVTHWSELPAVPQL